MPSLGNVRAIAQSLNVLGGIVKRSLAMAVSKASRPRIAGRMPATHAAIAKAFGLDDATRPAF
jgi:hypothetical protein